MLALLLCSVVAFAQRTVTGRVTDMSGEPLPGVYVLAVNSKEGAVTDEKGAYSIKVKDGESLLFSFLGMNDLTEPCDGRSVIDVTMTDDSVSLDEVVVVAYGEQKKASLTGAISSVAGGKLLEAPATNLSSLLGGRVAGVSSVQESGQPGADQAILNIRGSRYGVTYIVDGFVRSISDIDPNDIASVSVLKDASAAALYGMQSAGGVIIVTTKKGDRDANAISYTGTVGISQNANFPKFLNAEQFAWYYNKGLEMDGYPTVFTQEQVALMKNGDDSDGWGDTDWTSKIFGTGINHKHNVSAQGGNDRVRYYVSFGYLGQKGNIEGYSYQRFNLRSNIDAKLAKDLKLSIGVSGQKSDTKAPGFASGGSEAEGEVWMSVARQAIAMHPYLPEKYEGYYTATPNRIGQPCSPLSAIRQSGYNNSDNYYLQTNATLRWDMSFLKGMSLQVSGSFDHNYSTSKILSTPYEVMLATLPTDGSTTMRYTKVLDPRATSYNTLAEGLSRWTSLVGNAQLAYNNKFADKHTVDAMFVAELRSGKSNGFSSYGKEVPFEELPELGFAKPADSPIGGWSNGSRSAGFLVRARYEYADRYFVEFSGRVDGSYKFSGNVSGKRWGFFPAGSVGWRINEEPFFGDARRIVDDLKLRFSVGELGNDNVSPYSFLNQYGFSSPLFINGNRYNALSTSGIANKNLTWERVRSYNLGVDLLMWGGKLGVNVDAFYNYNYDILTYMGSSYPPSMGGYYPTIENYNKTDSRGVEVVLSHTNTAAEHTRHPLRYSISFNLTYAYSRWLKYPDSANVPEWQVLTGKEVGSMLGWVADGLYQSEEEIDNSAWPFGQRPRCGDIKYVDLNGDGVIGYEDKAFSGQSNRPKLTAGLNFNLQWAGLDFSMLFTAGALFNVSLTGTYFNGNDDNTIYTETFKEGGNSPLYLVEGAWREDNRNGQYPRLTVNAPTNNNGLASTFWFRDGKYIRLKSIQLGYTFPLKWTQTFKCKQLRLFFEGSNIFTISGLPEGIDPESPGVNNGYYPQQRTFMGGLTITF